MKKPTLIEVRYDFRGSTTFGARQLWILTRRVGQNARSRVYTLPRWIEWLRVRYAPRCRSLRYGVVYLADPYGEDQYYGKTGAWIKRKQGHKL